MISLPSNATQMMIRSFGQRDLQHPEPKEALSPEDDEMIVGQSIDIYNTPEAIQQRQEEQNREQNRLKCCCQERIQRICNCTIL